jgi:hypothetical protein
VVIVTSACGFWWPSEQQKQLSVQISVNTPTSHPHTHTLSLLSLKERFAPSSCAVGVCGFLLQKGGGGARCCSLVHRELEVLDLGPVDLHTSDREDTSQCLECGVTHGLVALLQRLLVVGLNLADLLESVGTNRSTILAAR